MILQLPTRMHSHIDAGKRVMSLLNSAGHYISNNDRGDQAKRASDIEGGRCQLDEVQAELAMLNFAHQLLKTLQFGREGKWQEAYAEIEAAVAFSRGKADLVESWSLVRYQLDYMRVEAEPVTEQAHT